MVPAVVAVRDHPVGLVPLDHLQRLVERRLAPLRVGVPQQPAHTVQAAPDLPADGRQAVPEAVVHLHMLRALRVRHDMEI